MFGQVLSGIPIAILIVCFLAFVFASYRHFDTGSHSIGNLLIRVLTFVGTLVNLSLAWSEMPLSHALNVLTLIFGGASFWMFNAALRSTQAGDLHVAFTGSGPDKLVTSGIYRRIRNPLYTSYLAYWASWMLATAMHPVSVACFALFLVVYWFAVRQEEAFLTRQFGEQYVAFKSRTGRFLPRLSVLRN